jgi:hypothetical protein
MIADVSAIYAVASALNDCAAAALMCSTSAAACAVSFISEYSNEKSGTIALAALFIL